MLFESEKMAHSLGFIARHNLWSEDQKRRAEEIRVQVETENIELFRIAWADPHGASRAKTVTLPAFLSALEEGYNINVATTTLDASGARTFASFKQGGGMNLEEMTGSPNLIVVPHVGSATHSAREKMAALAVDNLLAALDGQPMPHAVG